MAVSKVCCTCLSYDVDMFSLSDDDIRECLQKVTNIKIQLEDEVLQYVCEECSWLLHKFAKFKDKCLKANQILRQMLSQSAHISEALLKAECHKLYQEMTTNSEIDPIIPDTKLVKQDNFSYKSEYNLNSENKSEFFNQNEIIIKSADEDEKPQYDSKIEPDKYDYDIQDAESSVNSESVESNNVEDEKLHKHEDEVNIKHPGKKKIKGSVTENKLWKSDNVVLVTLTKEQQMEELSKRNISKTYLNATFKCVDCVQGFLSEMNYKKHMDLHNETCGELQCDICKLRFCNMERLRFHQTLHSERYKCLTCGELTKTHLQAMRHFNRHGGTDSYECNLCDEKFQLEQVYIRHTRTAHPTQYVCDLCGDYFTTQARLDAHKRRPKDCRKLTESSLQCKMCDGGVFKLRTWYRHMLGHANKEKQQNAPKECQICGHQTTTWTDWSHHVVYEHYNMNANTNKTDNEKKPPKKCVCDYCGQTLSSRASMTKHIGSQHSDGSRVSAKSKFSWKDKCKVCNKNILRSNMKRHLITHTDEKPFKCDHCEKCFNQSSSRDMHIRTVHDKSSCKKSKNKSYNYPCQLCPRRFHGKSSLATHEATHTGVKPFSCDICQRKYTNEYYLEVHRNIHTGKKPYSCDICNEKFTNKNYVRNHMRKHTGETFDCDVCDKRFTLKYNLERHQLVHTGVKNHTCDLCGKTFAQALTLRLHINTVHLHLPHPPRKPRKRKTKE